MTAAEAAISQPAPAAPLLPVARIQRVQLGGTLIGGDSQTRLLDFLAIGSTTPGGEGVLWDEQLQSRVRRDLDVLGYAVEPSLQPEGLLVLTLRPIRAVRRIAVRGNWPIFETEILSFLTWRTGYRLPEGDELLTEIRKQERELISFLQRKGYYDATAQFQLRWDAAHPERVDVTVQINLNTGFWRLRYKLGTVTANKLTLLSQRELTDFFDHCCVWWGRTSYDRITDDFKRLTDYYQSKGYAGVRLTKRLPKPDRTRRVVDIDLAVEERQRIVLKFAGRRALSEAELKKAVTIFRDAYYSANEFDESARNIYRLYQQQGFFEARVKWHWKNRNGDPVEVQFDIHEGPQLKVRDINFATAEPGTSLHYPAAKLQEQISTRRYPRLGFIGLGEGGFASAVQIEQDVQRLEEFYRREGYAHPRVTATVGRSPAALRSAPLLGLLAALDDGSDKSDSGDLFVRFTIDEGERELVDGLEIKFAEQHTITEAQVRKELQLLPGKPYTAEALVADTQRLYNLFKASGHPYPDIDPRRSTWNENHTRVTLRWVLDEREAVRFGPIIIRGNFATRESIIRTDLPFKTGDVYNERRLLEAQQNLETRQIFSSVRVIPDPGLSTEYGLEAGRKGWRLRRNPVPILVEVIERYDYAGDISAYLGVSTYESLLATVTYNWRNVFGTASEVYLTGDLGVRVQALLARYTNPRVFGSFLRFDLRGFWRNENTYSFGQVTSYGANAELTRFFASTDEQGRRLPPTLRIFTKLEYKISQILVPLNYTQGVTNVSGTGDRTQAFKWSVGFVLDRRVGFEAPSLRLRNLPVPPNPLRPASGYLLSGEVTGAVCCGSNTGGSFIALAGQAVLLKPFGPELHTEDGWIYGMRRFKLNLNLRLHYSIPLARSGIPLVELYFAGGDSSTRGYDNDALRAELPRSPLEAQKGETAFRIVPQGGSSRILSQIEWEFAITPKLLSWPWVGAVFVDTGAVFNGVQNLSWNDVRFSLGVSLLRLHTQFGALSLDYAYPLTLPGQEHLDQTDRWKFQDWYQHFPGRIHFNWGMNINL